MVFHKMMRRLLCILSLYNIYLKTDKKIKYERVVKKMANLIKCHIDQAQLEDLIIIEQYIASDYLYCSELGADFSSIIFQKNILLEPQNRDVISGFSVFLEVYGWMGESEQINKFLQKEEIEKAAIFAVNLEIYRSGHQYEMTDEEIEYMVRSIK